MKKIFQDYIKLLLTAVLTTLTFLLLITIVLVVSHYWEVFHLIQQSENRF